MKVAALYDIHGMADALAAVLEDVERANVDLIVIGGDVVAGPQPGETLELLHPLGDRLRWVRGNADRVLGGDADAVPEEGGAAVEWTAKQLRDEQRSFLATLPESQTLQIDGLGRGLFCHATPRNDTEVRTAISSDDRWQEVLDGVAERVVVCGHTHIQFDRVVGGVRVVNAGSVGMPYEDEPGAYWAVLGPDVELRRTPYDVEAALDRIAASGYPEQWPRATRTEATEYFETFVK